MTAAQIAAFFNQVKTLDLTESEKNLRDYLVQEGFLQENGNGDYSGDIHRVLLTVSQDIAYVSRKDIITHERIHGIIESNLAFVRQLEKNYATLTDEEKNFLKEIMSDHGYYSTDDHTVMHEAVTYFLAGQTYSTNDPRRAGINLSDSEPHYRKKYPSVFQRRGDFNTNISDALQFIGKKLSQGITIRKMEEVGK